MTVHLYVKDLTSHSVDVILYEDELQVKFCTRCVFGLFVHCNL